VLRARFYLPPLSKRHGKGKSGGAKGDKPLVSYQINRQLSGWIPPPLMIRAFGAHCLDISNDITTRAHSNLVHLFHKSPRLPQHVRNILRPDAD
jgi:hypothetical protein